MERDVSGAVIVVGGGLAGMAAALEIARGGRPVTLYERRPFLGGRVFSFVDSGTGATIDNGQHVLVGACDRLLSLLGASGRPRGFLRQSRLSLPVIEANGRRTVLGAAPFPAPLHLLPALATYRALPMSARFAVARDVRALVKLDPAERLALDDTPLGVWLAARGTPTIAVERFWDMLVRPALNVAAAGANVPLTAFLIEEALWKNPSAGAMWLPAAGLHEAIVMPLERALSDAGVRVRTGARVHALEADNGRVRGLTLVDGKSVRAAHVVSAVPPDALDTMLPPNAHPEARYSDLGTRAIVNVYLWYDRPITDLKFAGVLDPDLQWIFNRSLLLGHEAAGGECIGVSLSAADDLLDRPKRIIADAADRALRRVFPERSAARRLRHAVVKEPRATFHAGPGCERARPHVDEAPLEGLFLAGDWTATGWPATMEGAVRSGQTAARAVLRAAAREHTA